MAQPRSERTHARPRQRPNWLIWTLVSLLLAAVLAGTLWVPIYSRTTPALAGFPFFYWYQLVWVPVVALVSWCAYLLSRRAQRGTAAPPVPAPPGPPLSAPPGHTAALPFQSPAGPPGSAAPPPLPKRQVPPRAEGTTPTSRSPLPKWGTPRKEGS
jgi:hypothetical protein